MHIPVPILLRVVRTTVGVWFASRMALAVVGVGALFAEGYLIFLGAVVALVWFDLGRSRERVFFANLGVSGVVLLAVAGVATVVLELTLGLGLSQVLTELATRVPR